MPADAPGTAALLNGFGASRRRLLRALLRAKDGRTVDELTGEIDVTRTAINQHLSALEREGFVARGEPQKTGGRPGQVYVLTPKGLDLFPKQYSWFSSLLLAALKSQAGADGVVGMLQGIAGNIAAELEPRLAGKDAAGRVREIVTVLNELSYDARLASGKAKGGFVVEATNCVYHTLASEHPEVCGFDLELLGRLSGAKVEHQECIVRGGNVCRFLLTPPRDAARK